MQTLLQEVVDDPSGNKMLLVMDYMEGGPVMTREALERGRCIPESLACQYFRDMCKVRSSRVLSQQLYGRGSNPLPREHALACTHTRSKRSMLL